MPKKERKSKTQVKLKPGKVAALVDKNSRTILKIIQLIEINQRKGAKDIDKDGVISRRIEMLKMRLNRRLLKLSKWADTPEEERNPVPAVSQEKQVLFRSSNGKFASSSSVIRGQSFVNYTHMTPVAQYPIQSSTKPGIILNPPHISQNSIPPSSTQSTVQGPLSDTNPQKLQLVKPIAQQPHPSFPSQCQVIPQPSTNQEEQFAAVLELQRQLSQNAGLMLRQQPLPPPLHQRPQMEIHAFPVSQPLSSDNVVRSPSVSQTTSGSNIDYIPTVSSRIPNVGYQYAADSSINPPQHTYAHPLVPQSTALQISSGDIATTIPQETTYQKPAGQQVVEGGEVSSMVEENMEIQVEIEGDNSSLKDSHGPTSND